MKHLSRPMGLPVSTLKYGRRAGAMANHTLLASILKAYQARRRYVTGSETVLRHYGSRV